MGSAKLCVWLHMWDEQKICLVGRIKVEWDESNLWLVKRVVMTGNTPWFLDVFLE